MKIGRYKLKITLPKAGSHKGDNGRLLIVAGSEKYHGSLIYAVKAASRIVDLIYVLSTAENLTLTRKLKSQTAEFIPVSRPNFQKYDCVLAGPGMGISARTRSLVRSVLKSRVKCVLDADALNVLDDKLKKFLHPNCILTPHGGEFKRLTLTFSPPYQGGDEEGVRQFAEKYNCTVLLKSPKADVIASPGHKLALNYTGNQGMTKGGTGDILAGLVAALFCKNDAFTSAYVGVYVNGKAGDELYKKVGPFYDAEDLLNHLPDTLWRTVR